MTAGPDRRDLLISEDLMLLLLPESGTIPEITPGLEEYSPNPGEQAQTPPISRRVGGICVFSR